MAGGVIIEKLKEYDRLYYEEGTSPISDKEYDELKESARKYDPTNEYFQDVGAETKSAKVRIPYILGSLHKAKIDTIEKWIGEHPGPHLYSAKVDGVSFLVVYRDGEVQFACTRGDGRYGKDITSKAKIFCPGIKVKDEVILRGDATLEDKLTFKNRRNGAAGILNRDDDELASHIQPIFYEVIRYGDLPIENEYQEMVTLESLDLPLSPWKYADDEFDMEYLLNFYKEVMSISSYDVDGVVVSVNESKREDTLWPENKVAFKLQGEIATSKVEYVEWNTSRSGRIVPVIVIEPVEIDGVMVSRATGFNAMYIEQNDITTGSTVELIRSGSVIPYILKVEGGGEQCKLPDKCPSCGYLLDRKGVDLVCGNDRCDDSNYKSVEYFLRTLGAENITEKTLRKLSLDNIEELYRLDEFDIAETEGFGKKSADIILSEIKKTLRTTPDKLLASFGIPGVSTIMAKKLLNCFGSIDKVLELEPEVLQECGGVGPQISLNVYNEAGRCMELYEFLVKEAGMKIIENAGDLDGKVFTLTGKGPYPRKEIQGMIEKFGGIVKGASKTTNYLVTDDVNSNSGKMAKAREYGTVIISYDELIKMLEE